MAIRAAASEVTLTLPRRLSLDIAVPSSQRPRKSGLNWFMPASLQAYVFMHNYMH